MPTYIVASGDSIPSIAKDNGFFWKTLWNRPENAELKQLRKDPNLLFPGDEVFIPEKELKEEDKAVDQKHKFKRKGEPLKIKMQLKMLGEPRKNEEYIIDIDGTKTRGTTDGDGKLEHLIPGNSRGGSLSLNGGKEVIPILLGVLDPVEELSGVQQRLNNLGLKAGAEDGQLSDETKSALKDFQERHELPATGEANDETKAKLKEVHP